MEGNKFNFKPLSMKEFEDKLGFSKVRNRRESAAIFNGLNEGYNLQFRNIFSTDFIMSEYLIFFIQTKLDTCTNLLNDHLELSREFEEEDIRLTKETATPGKYMEFDTDMEVTCYNKVPLSQNDNINVSHIHSILPSKYTREDVINKDSFLGMDSGYQQNVQAIHDTTTNYDTSEAYRNNSTFQNQSSTVGDKFNDESLPIEQRARNTLKQFKNLVSKLKTSNEDAQPSPNVSVSKSELRANVSHIKCPDDVVHLVDHLLYSPIGIHRTHPAQEIKLQETQEQCDFENNNDDSPLKKYSTKKHTPSDLIPEYNKQEILSQKDDVTKTFINQVDLQQSMSLEDSSENLNERSELRKRKRSVVKKPLTPHINSTNVSNKIQTKSDTSPAAKKMKTQVSKLRAPTSISLVFSHNKSYQRGQQEPQIPEYLIEIEEPPIGWEFNISKPCWLDK
ncbi:9650_t:CDS:2 [Funneliformis geosporum]|uniref:9650_t:CDS:1 n=1 Tax=Funneliformis geosporum TaxID=1117311 RepID=A0A9W4T1C6_9GLOM|nr:9650_t:CDS:2 [Funneliformis geosporum]